MNIYIRASLSLLVGVVLAAAAASPAYSRKDRKDIDIQQQVVLGAPEPDYKFPWVVSVSGTLTGKGVLIAPQWVLTAAHVTGPGYNGVQVNYSRTAPDGRSTNGSTTTGIGSVYVHPDYVPGTPSADLALVRLPAPLGDDPYLQPAELPMGPAAVGQPGLVASFSHTFPLPPGHLAVLRAPILLAGGSTFIARSPSSSLCPGDSGSGFVTVREGLINVVTGIASQASVSDCDKPNQEFEAVDVYKHVGWIRTKTGIGLNDNVKFYKTDGSGGIEHLRSRELYEEWDIVVPGNFGGGDGFGDMLFYNRLTGTAVFTTTDGAGGLHDLRTHTDWDKNWDMIIPGDFGGDGHTDLLFYRRSTGTGAFYSTDGAGRIHELRSYVNWDTTWDIVVPGNFNGDAWTDLFFYDRDAGTGLFEATGGQGNIYDLQDYSGLDRTWDLIVPGDFGGDGATDLLFYDRDAGLGYFGATDGRGGIYDLATYTDWDKTWNAIVPGNFGGNGRTDLFFYDRDTGAALFAATNGEGGVAELQNYPNIGRIWDSVVVQQFGGGPSSDLFLYHR